MGRLAQRRTGQLVHPSPRGFPGFYGTKRMVRTITGDVWAFLHHLCERRLTADGAVKTHAFIDQAFGFYNAAANPRQASRPLLYYYAFLNLAKVFLVHKGVAFPPALKHGIRDPKANIKQKLHFKTQEVVTEQRDRDHSRLFPELVDRLGGRADSDDHFRVLDLLGQIPAIHRTYCLATSRPASFCPAEFEVYKDQSHVWTVASFRKHDRDSRVCLDTIRQCPAFGATLTPVKAGREDRVVFESSPRPFHGRGLDGVIGHLAADIRGCGVWATLTNNGYVYYMSPKSGGLPQICSSYAAMFYLGSITRYKPYDYAKIVKGYSWLLGEFLDTQPVQVLYLLASTLAETEVVLPHAKGVRNL